MYLFFTSHDPPFVRIIIRTQAFRYKWGTGGHLVTDRKETFLIILGFLFLYCLYESKLTLPDINRSGEYFFKKTWHTFSRCVLLPLQDSTKFKKQTNKQKQFSSKKKSILEILQETKINM